MGPAFPSENVAVVFLGTCHTQVAQGHSVAYFAGLLVYTKQVSFLCSWWMACVAIPIRHPFRTLRPDHCTSRPPFVESSSLHKKLSKQASLQLFTSQMAWIFHSLTFYTSCFHVANGLKSTRRASHYDEIFFLSQMENQSYFSFSVQCYSTLPNQCHSAFLGSIMFLVPNSRSCYIGTCYSVDVVFFHFSITFCIICYLALFIIPLMLTFDTFIKNTHGFIGTSNLNLHKKGFVIIARRTYGHGSIHIFPCGGTS